MIRLAIDPGANGGLAWRQDDQPAQAAKMPPTARDMVDLIRAINPDEAHLEDVVKFAGKGQSGASAVTYGVGWGEIHGALIALGVRVLRPRPQAWQKKIGLARPQNMTPTAWKNKIKARAQELFPGVRVTLATADALCILEAAER
jgi:hypothetical protein